MAHRTIVSLAFYQLLSSNRTGVFLVYLPLFLVEARGASISVALAFTSAAYFGGSLIAPLAGRWSDRTGHRKSFLIGAELGALPFYLAVPLVPGYLLAGTVFVLGTVVLGVGSPALNAFVADASRSEERGGSYGTLTSTSAIGSIAGFLVVATLVSRLGFTFLFYFAAAIMVGAVLFVLLAVREPGGPTQPQSIPSRGVRPLVLFSTAVSVRTLGTGAVGAFLGIWAVQLGGSYFDVALIVVAGLLTTALLGIASGRAVDRRGEWRSLVWGSAISTVAWLAFLLSPRWYFLLGAQSVRQLGFVLLSPAMLVWVSRIAPPGRRAEYLGVFALINSGFWSLGPSAGALAYELGGGEMVFLTAIAATLLSFAAMAAFQHHYQGTVNAASKPPEVPPGSLARD